MLLAATWSHGFVSSAEASLLRCSLPPQCKTSRSAWTTWSSRLQTSQMRCSSWHSTPQSRYPSRWAPLTPPAPANSRQRRARGPPNKSSCCPHVPNHLWKAEQTCLWLLAAGADWALQRCLQRQPCSSTGPGAAPVPVWLPAACRCSAGARKLAGVHAGRHRQ